MKCWILTGEAPNIALADRGYRSVETASGARLLTLSPFQYRSEVELSGSSDIAAAACRRLRRANSVGVDQSNAEWGRFSL